MWLLILCKYFQQISLQAADTHQVTMIQCKIMVERTLHTLLNLSSILWGGGGDDGILCTRSTQTLYFKTLIIITLVLWSFCQL